MAKPTPTAASAAPAGAPISGARLWELLRTNAPMLVRAMLADMSMVGYSGGVMTLACDDRIRSTAEKRLPELGRLLSSLSGTGVTCQLADAHAEPVRGGAEQPETRLTGEVEIDDPVVRHAIEVFNGRIVEVKPLPRGTAENEGQG